MFKLLLTKENVVFFRMWLQAFATVVMVVY